jgi:flagellar biosynthetic protein FliQ
MDVDVALLETARDALILALKIAAPILGAGIAIGLFISILQSITSIQEQTLTFVPKIFSMVIVAALLISWIAKRIGEFAIEMFQLNL